MAFAKRCPPRPARLEWSNRYRRQQCTGGHRPKFARRERSYQSSRRLRHQARGHRGQTLQRVFSELVPGARVVKAFNHLDAQVFANLDVPKGQRAFFLAGDDPAAKAQIAKLIGQLDLASIDLGPLEAGGRLIELPFGPLSIINLVKI